MSERHQRGESRPRQSTCIPSDPRNMKPKIIALTGVTKGGVAELSDDFSAGRDEDNSLALDDRMVSRHHCVIRRERGLYAIHDLDSHNGTLVNGVPVKEQTLKHGDRIQIGGNLFLFLLYEGADLPSPDEIEFDDSTPVSASAAHLTLESAIYSIARDLNLLLKVSQLINTADSLKDFQARLLDSILEVIPAERGAILMCEGNLESPTSVSTSDRMAGPGQPMHVSRTVARKVLSEGVSVLSSNIEKSDSLKLSESLTATRTRSVLCVPLALRGRTVGIVYLETGDPKSPLDEDHLQLVTAITGFVSGPLDNMRYLEWLEGENRRLNDDSRIEHNMVGESARMRDIYQFVAKVAPTDSTVLIRGESGTGKELVARAIHQNSPRAGKPFVAVNCAALTDTLLESELLGHEKGAFTGAYAMKKGKFEVADGGTIFLDEVGEMSPTMQAKFLRVLQEREFERVGGSLLIRVNVRMLAATNKDLEAAVKAGEFRQDLYYRLNVISRTVPPLRERREDIPLLSSYFVVKYSKKCKRVVTGLSPEARACLVAYDWPGNVRELENAVERAVVIGSTDRIQPEDLPEHVLEAMPLTEGRRMNYHESLREAKRQLVLKALGEASGARVEAARLLGIHPNNLHRLLRNLGLK